MSNPLALVTGAGALCAQAGDRRSFAQAILARGEAPPAFGLDPCSRLNLHQARRLDRLSQLLLLSAMEAASEARLRELPGERVGIVVGTGLGCLEKTEAQLAGLARKGLAFADPLGFPDSMDNAPAAHIAIELGCRGPTTTLRAREISGESALLLALRLMAAEEASAVVVVSGDAPSTGTRDALARFAPGLVAGEGAGALVLESVSSAVRRGARPLASVLGAARAFGRRGSPLRLAPESVVAAAAGAALAQAACHAGDAFVVAEDALQEKLGWCPGDGLLRAILALELLPGARGKLALVRGRARGAAAAALVLGPSEAPS